MAKKPRKRRTKAEAILHEARTEPSATSMTPVKSACSIMRRQRAFAKLDVAIEAARKRGRSPMSGTTTPSNPSIPSTLPAILLAAILNSRIARGRYNNEKSKS